MQEGIFVSFIFMKSFLQTPIEFLKGVGPKRAELLNSEAHIFTYEDLLYYFPFRYVDRTIFHKIREINGVEGAVQLKGRITRLSEAGSPRSKRLVASFEDETGRIDLVWFKGAQWIKKSIVLNKEIIVYGTPKVFGAKYNIPHPELSEVKDNEEPGLQPVYPSTEKLTSSGLHARGIAKLTFNLLQIWKDADVNSIPENVVGQLKLISKNQALRSIHFPENIEVAQKARFRLKFEELFLLQLELLVRKKISMQKSKGIVIDNVGNYFNDFYNNYLPFELTGAQKKVLREIRADMKTGFHMNRLLQGDVGSGKTLVALLTMLMVIGEGYQGALMAPTEILAIQHFESISKLLEPIGLRVALLTGSTKKKDRRVLHEGLEDGSIDILIGTHALLEDVVQFKNLGVVVIDEQHRFGVAQRAKMWNKNDVPPHILIMTATPIPRTLAMTFYGDLDVSVIDELPPGRKPITTIHRFDSHRAQLFGFLREEIQKGRQVYVVYPLIHESEKLDYNNLMDGFEAITKAFPRPKYHVSIVHGQMKPEDKEYEMNRFVKGETHIMVATTVIEVGVNVPNASVMVIESAERFGLSQLHQLRGRVGRGAEKSYCILMTGDDLGQESLKRMQTMVSTNDGFEISEVDLQLRGPGDIMGTQQSGLMNLKIADLSKDGAIVAEARAVAKEILKVDPNLNQPENANLRQRLVKILKNKPDWGKIS